MEIVGWILFVVGIFAVLPSYVWILIIAFRDNIGHGLACLLCSCYLPIYSIMNLDTCSTPFCINVFGTAALYGGARLAGFDLGV